MIRVVLPPQLRTLAGVGSEVDLEVAGEVTIEAVLDAVETRFPMLRGTMRDQATHTRRPFIRFYAGDQDISHQPADTPLPALVAEGKGPLVVVGAMSGG